MICPMMIYLRQAGQIMSTAQPWLPVSFTITASIDQAGRAPTLGR